MINKLNIVIDCGTCMYEGASDNYLNNTFKALLENHAFGIMANDNNGK